MAGDGRSGRSSWRRSGALIAGAAAISLLLYLFTGPSGAPEPPANLDSLEFADGTLTLVEERRLRLRPLSNDGARRELEFVIRNSDAKFFDIAHMQSHSSVALPTRIYFVRDGGRRLARYKADAPVNSD